MIYKITNLASETLLEYPETGMGYQIIETTKNNSYLTKKMVVYNSNLAVDLDFEFIINKNKILTKGYSNVLNKAEELMLDTDVIRVLNKSDLKEVRFVSESRKLYKTLSSAEKGRKNPEKANGALDNSKEKANGEEVFVRISAYNNDKRIDFVNKKLKKGSFTTTEIDYNSCVATNDDSIDRYALPNNEEIKWAFYIKPKKDNTLQRGVAQPAFEKNGGGIEAYFEDGTTNKTYLYENKYGK